MILNKAKSMGRALWNLAAMIGLVICAVWFGNWPTLRSTSEQVILYVTSIVGFCFALFVCWQFERFRAAKQSISQKTNTRELRVLRDHPHTRRERPSLAVAASATPDPPVNPVCQTTAENQDAISILVNLGYRRRNSADAVLAAQAQGIVGVDALVQHSLRTLTRNRKILVA